eukprot:g44704.t1
MWIYIMATIDTTDSQLKVERISKKITHIDTDIMKCNRAQKIPKGLQIMNPLKSTCNTEEYMNTRVISRSHKVAQNVTQAQRNIIHALKTDRIAVIKPADKGGAIIIQKRTDYCKEVYRQLDNQEHYRQLSINLTEEHSGQLNRLGTCLPKIHKANTAGHPIVRGDGSLCENRTGYVEDAILQLIRFILYHNVFTFNNQFFIQTHGTAMGTRFAPQYANIFMHR